MKSLIVLVFIAIHVFVGVVPFYKMSSAHDSSPVTSMIFPSEFEGARLFELPLSQREERFVRGFPGDIRRFTDGRREFVIRLVHRATRKLHPGTDCFRGVGYRVQPIPARLDLNGRQWGCFVAEKSGNRLRVCERIEEHNGRGWYDVSSWYWEVLLEKRNGPWTALTVVERL